MVVATFDTLAPGLHLNVPEATYHAINLASASAMKMLRRSPMHYKHWRDQPTQDTAALRFGRALHAAILEPDDFSSRFPVAKPCCAMMKSGQRKDQACNAPGIMTDGRDWFCGRHGDALAFDTPTDFLGNAEIESIAAIKDAIESHNVASELLGGQGANEAVIVWDDEHTGVRCKARIDRYTAFKGQRCHVDIKTCQDASRHAFGRDCGNFGYHIQAAMYLDAADTIKKAERTFIFIAVEKEPPHAVACYQMDDISVEQGRREYRRLLEIYKRCTERNEWPDYTPDGLGWVSIPSYMLD